MTDRRDHVVNLKSNPEPLPGEFGADLAQLDRALGEKLSEVDVPSGLVGRVFSMSADFLTTPVTLPFRRLSPRVTVRQRRTTWARFAVAASLATLCVLSLRVVMNNGMAPALPMQPEMVATASLEPPLHDAVEMLLLDRSASRGGEEIAYLFDPDPRDSSDMSLYVQTREVTLDDVSIELAMLEAELNM